MANGETGTRVTPGTGHLSRVTCHVGRCDDYYVTSPSAEAGTLSRYSPHTAAERMPGPVRQVVTYIETTANGEHIGPMVPGCGNHRSRVTTPAPWTLQLPQLLLVHIYTHRHRHGPMSFFVHLKLDMFVIYPLTPRFNLLFSFPYRFYPKLLTGNYKRLKHKNRFKKNQTSN